MSCGKCRVKLKRQDLIIDCDGFCKKSFHVDCVNITKNSLEDIERNNNIKWFCNNCLETFEFAFNISLEIQTMKKSFQKEIEDLKNEVSGKYQETSKTYLKDAKVKTYAQVTEAVVIKPKTSQDCTKTKEAVRKNLDPTLLEVGISQVRNSKEGSIVIRCNTKEDVEKIKSAAESKLKKNYEIRAPERKNPRIKIVDFEDNLSSENLISTILKQNSFLSAENREMKVVTVRKMISRYMAIIECDPATFKTIMERSRLNIGWVACRVYEYIPVLRCYKCGEYNHKAEGCQNKDRCLKCGKEDHKMDNCQSEGNVCVNCRCVNEKNNLNLKTEHSIFDMNCPTYKRIVEAEKRKIKTSS